MLKLRYALTAIVMLLLIASFAYGGQNTAATVSVDLYSAAPTTTSNQGNTTISGIGANDSVYVKVYLNNVSNAFLYYIELLVEPSKLTWEKYGLSDAKVSLTGEVNILNKEQTDYTAVYGGASTPGTADGIYTKVKVGAYMSVLRSIITDTYAADGNGLAAVVLLKTSSTFTTSDMANILLKKIVIENNGQPSSVIDSVVVKTQVLGIINADTTKAVVNATVQETVTTNTDTVKAEYQDGTVVEIAFTGGTSNVGKTVETKPLGSVLSDSIKAIHTNYGTIAAKAAAYFNVESNHAVGQTFQARLKFKYSTAHLAAAGITEGSLGESKLVLAFFNTGNAWEKVTTTIDTAINEIYSDVDHFSTWSIVDSTADLVPVELASLSARIDAKDNIILEWTTTSETNNYGFYVERSKDNIKFEQIGFVKGNGTSYEENSYSYVDIDALTVGEYYYRLKQVDFDGTYEYSGIAKATVKAPDKYELLSAYPNPFNPTTNITFSLKESGFVKLYVYNTLGQVVAELVNENMDAGKHNIVFNARNLASGMYIYRINVNGFTAAKKIVLLK